MSWWLQIRRDRAHGVAGREAMLGSLGHFSLTFLVTSGGPGNLESCHSSSSEAQVQSQPRHGDVLGGGL